MGAQTRLTLVLVIQDIPTAQVTSRRANHINHYAIIPITPAIYFASLCYMLILIQEHLNFCPLRTNFSMPCPHQEISWLPNVRRVLGDKDPYLLQIGAKTVKPLNLTGCFAFLWGTDFCCFTSLAYECAVQSLHIHCLYIWSPMLCPCSRSF